MDEGGDAMSIHVQVKISNTDDDRVMRYEAELDDLEILESHITGELRLTPQNAAIRDWGAKAMSKQMRTKSPWHRFLEGDWLAKEA
jgi:hypothetical protein